MKPKTSLLLLLAAASITSMAQVKNNEQDYKWGIGLQLYSPEKLNPVATGGNGFSEYGHFYAGTDLKEKSFFSYGIIAHYNTSNNITLRFRAGMNNRKITQYYNTIEGTGLSPTPGYYQIGNATIKQSAQRFGLGIQRTFHLNKFDACAGLEFQFVNYSHLTLDYLTTDVQDTVTYIARGHWDVPGGFLIGVGPYMGCNYYLMKRISISAEISYAFQYMKLGGNVYSDYETTVPSGGNTVVTQRNTVERIGFDEIRAMLSVSYCFGN